MSDSRQGPSRVGGAVPGPDSMPENPKAGNRAPRVPEAPHAEAGIAKAIVGPFTARDIAVFLGVFITFIGSLLPLVQRGSTLNLWNAQNLYFIGIGILLPLVLAGVFVWRRLSPEMAFRVGSLSLDQFASVVAAFACSYFFIFLVTALTPGAFVGFVGGAVLVLATVLAPVIPAFAVDFGGRAEVPAHVVARDAVAPLRKPKNEKPGSQKSGMQRPVPLRPSPASDEPQGAGSRFPEAARTQNAPSGAPAPWAGSLAPDGAGSPEHSGERAAGVSSAGISSAGAAAAATGAAGVAAAGADVAALAAGAMAAHGEGSRSAEARESGTDAPASRSADAPAGVAGATSSPTSSPTSSGGGDDELIGRHDSRTPPAAEVPVGAAADDAVVLGDADGEAYGAPAAAGPVEPTAEPSAGETAVMPSSSEPDERLAAGAAGVPTRAPAREPAETEPALTEPAPTEPALTEPAPTEPAPTEPVETEADRSGHGQGEAGQGEAGPGEAGRGEPAPTQASPVLPTAEPEGDSGPATQLAPAVDRSAGFEATRSFEEPEPEYEAFWFAVNHARAALDPESGLPLFTLEPGQWILALQDRGDEFLVQSQDGRIGVLRDLSGIERG